MREPANKTINARSPLSIWDLPASLLTQPHNFRRRNPKRGRERSHQNAILAYIYRNRFATAAQVQRRFPTFLKSDRTTRRHLAEMQESLGYLDAVPTPSPLWPKVYAVSSRGMRKLTQAFRKKQPAWEPPVADRGRIGYSIHHVYHELACTEFLLQVHEGAKEPGVELLETQRRSLIKNDAFRLLASSENRLVPDGMFLVRTRQGMICTFLEVDTGAMSMKQVAGKLQRYSTWAASTNARYFLTDLYRRHGATDPQPTFRLAFVCMPALHQKATLRLENLQRIVSQQESPIRNRVWFTTSGELQAITSPKFVFSAPIWRRCAAEMSNSTTPAPFLRS